MTDGTPYLEFLPTWLTWAESDWTVVDDERGRWGPEASRVLGHCAHGSYLAACALLATGPDELRARCHLGQDEMIERAMKSLRYILSNHVGQPATARHETTWGHHWGSPILVERIANFVDLFASSMPERDRALWHDMLVSEADHHCSTPIETNRFPAQGETHAERNYWRGSILLRAARSLPDHPHVPEWLDQSSAYFVNSCSVPEDAHCTVMLDGKPCSDWFIGANVHPDFVFEHHGAVSLDYCIHTSAFHTMIAISTLRKGWQPLDAMSHHILDLWNFTRRCILPNGRIAFVGGVCRPSYMLSQAYLLPVLVFQHRFAGDPTAGALAKAVYALMSQDRDASGDGSFYSCRGQGVRDAMGRTQPYYYYRLEADAVISLGLSHLISQLPTGDAALGPTAGELETEALHWPIHSRDAGLVLQRNDHGLFSVYWGRSDTAEADPPLALCIPFANPHRPNWLSNLATIFKPFQSRRGLVGWASTSFDGGFATAGRYHEARFLPSDDAVGYAIDQRLAFVLMPDGRTLIRLEKCTALSRVAIEELASLNLNLANDIFTGNEMTLAADDGERQIRGLGGEEGLQTIDSRWVNVNDELGVVSLYGPPTFTLETSSARQRQYGTLLVERLYYPLCHESQTFEEGECVIDTAVMLIANSPRDETHARARKIDVQRHPCQNPEIERLSFRAAADWHAVIVVNFTGEGQDVELAPTEGFEHVRAVTLDAALDTSSRVKLKPWGVSLSLHR